MQCPSCRFENLPGLESCGRCSTSLTLAGAVFDVNPPRASRTAKRVRAVVPRRVVYRARDAVREARRNALQNLAEDEGVFLPAPGVLRRLIVPGWGQIHSGLKLQGRIFLGVYLVFLFAGLSRWGTGTGSMLLGLAFSVHASSIVDVLAREGRLGIARILLVSACASLLLGALVYTPASWALMNLAAPIEFAGAVPPFDPGDVILVNRWAYSMWGPRRGDVVLTVPDYQSRRDESLAGSHRRDLFEDNQVIDRLVGLPGDRVQWSDGSLLVNGSPVSWKPLVAARLPDGLDVEVPGDRYLVLPTTSAAGAQAGGSPGFWKEAGLIRPENILGGVFLRISPVTRLCFFR